MYLPAVLVALGAATANIRARVRAMKLRRGPLAAEATHGSRGPSAEAAAARRRSSANSHSSSGVIAAPVAAARFQARSPSAARAGAMNLATSRSCTPAVPVGERDASASPRRSR